MKTTAALACSGRRFFLAILGNSGIVARKTKWLNLFDFQASLKAKARKGRRRIY